MIVAKFASTTHLRLNRVNAPVLTPVGLFLCPILRGLRRTARKRKFVRLPHYPKTVSILRRFGLNVLLTEKGAAVFLTCRHSTTHSKMAQSTNPVPTKHTVEVSQCQLAILNHFHGKDAQEMARLIRSVCTAAIKSETADYEDITCLFQFSEYVQELSNEHFAAAVEFQHQHKKFI